MHISAANLSGADLRHAFLRGADLSGPITGVNLSGADLLGANLSGANLLNVSGFTNDQLKEQAESLEGATMPNSQKYEEWLKSKGRGEVGETSGPS